MIRLGIAATLSVLMLTSSAAAADDTIHTIDRLAEDARGLVKPVKTRFEGKHAGTSRDPYVIDLTVEKMSSTGSGGWLVFREIDTENFYQLDFRATQMFLSRKVNGIMTKVAVGGRGFGAAFRPYSVRLEMAGNRFRVYEAGDLSTPVIDWTDAENLYPVGRNVSYYATPGTLFCWERVEARPLSATLELGGAWLLGGRPGYAGATKNTTGTDVVLANSRYPLTFERYDAPSDDGSVAYDMLEMGQHGSSTWRLVAPRPGATLVYRAGSRLASGLPKSGYAVRFAAGATRWGTVDGAGVFSAKATGRALEPGEDAFLVIDGSSHRVDGATGPIIASRTDSTFNGLRAYVAHLPGTQGRLAGTLTPR